MSSRKCIARLNQAAGRVLSDAEVEDIFARIHKAALDIKAGRLKEFKPSGLGEELDILTTEAAKKAAADMLKEAAKREQQANLQVLRLSALSNRLRILTQSGINPLKALELLIRREYTGRTNTESLEQRVAGHRAYFNRRLTATWDALGYDFLGYFQDRQKLYNLVRELRGEDTGDALAKKGAKAFLDVAEEARQVFNAAGGDIGKLMDWAFSQHHSQYKVAAAGMDTWINKVIPLLDRTRYVDDLGQPMGDKAIKSFLTRAWENIASDGYAEREPGARGNLKLANRHAEHREIHFKDAHSVISYWNEFGERTASEILHGHIDTMARDIAFVEHFGPNPDMTYLTLRDQALQQAIMADKAHAKPLKARARQLDTLYNYVSGKTASQVIRPHFKAVADGIAHLNVAGKLGGSAIASFFGDKPMMEAVAHLNNLPMMQRWRTELALLNPQNAADRRMLQRQGLMLDSVRSGLNRFYEGLGESSTTGKLANATMRVTGMQAINDIRKGAFGLSLMDAIGTEIRRGMDFVNLHESDIRALRHYGITEADWGVWKLAELDDLGRGNDSVLTPDSISRISDATIEKAGLVPEGETAASVRRNAIVKLLGAVNTESEFAIVTPGWKERSEFYGGIASERGSIPGEITRAALQFKSFPWTMGKRFFDAILNADGPVGKATMTAFLLTTTSLAGAMIVQVREVLAGKDPLAMANEDWKKFWGKAFLQGGAIGIYGDFFYSVNQTRYGSGPLEIMAGPTIGPILDMGLVTPLNELKKAMEGEETHFWAKEARNIKGFVPFGNVWYGKAAMEHLVFQQVMEGLSPGYLSSVRRRTAKEYGQDWWWRPGELLPERAPELSEAIK